METRTDSSNSKTKAVLIIIGGIACIVTLLCLIFHLTPVGMLYFLADYAAHHYFVLGFFSLLIALGSWRLYTTLEGEIDRKYQKKNTRCIGSRKRRTSITKLLRSHYQKCSDEESEFVSAEVLGSLEFTQEDVLQDASEMQQRERDLQKASLLGSSLHRKVILMLKDYKSRKHVMTTVWAFDKHYVRIKEGLIPIKSIYKIEF